MPDMEALARAGRAAALAAVVATSGLWPAAAAQTAADRHEEAMPIAIGLHQLTVVRASSGPIVAVMTSPPGVVHVALRDGVAALVPERTGHALVAIGLGGTRVAWLDVTVSESPGARSIVVAEPAAPSHAAAAPQRAEPQAQAQRATASQPQPPVPATPQHAPAQQSPASPRPAPAPTRATAPAQQVPASPIPAPSPTRVAASAPSAPLPAAASQARPAPEARAVQVVDPPGVRVTAVVTFLDGSLYVSYVIQNASGSALSADPHAVRVGGASGPVVVRQIDVDTPQRIAPGGVETGVIVLRPASPAVTITWPLRDDRGAERAATIRVEAGAAADHARAQ